MRILTTTTAIAAALAFAAGPAQAAGGANISSGPSVAPGTQYFGDTNDGKYSGDCPADYWNLAMAAGDQATVDWTSLTDSNGDDYANRLYVWPAGTTDFSINNRDPQESFEVGDNHLAESIFTAGETGTYPLMFYRRFECGGTGGPYSFTVAVRHSVVLSLGSVKGLSDRKGPVTVGVFTPDGQPITDPNLRVALRAGWSGRKQHDIAAGSPNGGAVSFAVTLPKATRGKRVSLRAISGGESYRSAHSATRTVNVKRR
jgi:hypothetical protein